MPDVLGRTRASVRDLQVSIRLVAAAALCAGLSFAAPPVLAQQAGDANAGIRVYKEFGNCWDCHGWSGLGGLPHVGGDHDGEDAGPPIIRSTLTTAAMIEMVACGKPDGRHPAFAADGDGDSRPAKPIQRDCL